MRIQIPNPCTENWQQMPPKDQGRHCEKCSKTVVDFTTMSDKGVVDYMNANPNSCGKFSSWQLNRDLTKNIFSEKPKNWVNCVAVACFLSAQLPGSDLKAQNTIQLLESKLADTNSTKIQCLSVSNIFKFRITNDTDSLHQISKIKIELDTFSMVFDSVRNQNYSFHIPSGLNYENAKITLVENDSVSTVLFVPKNTFSITNPLYFESPTINFYKDSTSWKFISEMPFYYNPRPYEVMGVPPMINYFDTSIFKNIYYEIVTSYPLVAIPPEVVGDTAVIPIDTPKTEPQKEEMITPLEPENKFNLVWKFLFFIGLGSFIYFVSQKLRKRN